MPTPGIDNLIKYTRLCANSLQEVADESTVPFLSSVPGVSLLILETIQSVKRNKDQWMHLMERINQIMFAIVSVCFAADGSLSPKVLDSIGEFAETLQRIHSFLRANLELNKFRRFFKQGEIVTQLDACETKLQQILESFGIQTGASLVAAMMEMQINDEQRHEELVKLLTRNDSEVVDDSSSESFEPTLLPLGNSSSALSILPGRPKIFHGRDEHLRNIVAAFLSNSARVVILGPGGIGKTSLALAALHHEDIIAKYPHRHFISCESANNCSGLIATIGAYLGIEPSRQLSGDIVQYLSERGLTMLILDNFETPWEPLESRAAVEEFISLLTDIPQLALLITMRGAERPAKVKWNRPFVPPLEPLGVSAARQTFVDIADEPCNEAEEAEIAELISLTGQLPLAVSLMASVASLEGYSMALERWSTERTSLLSDGYDKRSNLDLSIKISVASPRLASSPTSKRLLSLLSVLPDGISDADLFQSNIFVDDLAQSKSTLIRTSLAYIDHDGRLKMLPPIREYIRVAHPPEPLFVQPLRTHMASLLELWKTFRQLPSGNLTVRLTSNLGNVRSLLLIGLAATESSEIKNVVSSILNLNDFSQGMLMGPSDLMKHLPSLIDSLDSTELWLQYSTSQLSDGYCKMPVCDVNVLVDRSIEICKGTAAVPVAAEFYITVAHYYNRIGDTDKALHFIGVALSVSEDAGDVLRQHEANIELCDIHLFNGRYREARATARRAQKFAQILGDFRGEARCLIREARILCLLGQPSAALRLCTSGRELITRSGLQGSDTYIHLLDSIADIHLKKSEYEQSRQCNEEIVCMTSPTRSPFFHLNALINLAFIDLAMEAPDAEINRNLDLASSLSTKLGWPHGSLAREITMAGVHLRQEERATARTIYLRSIDASRNFSTEIMAVCLEKLADLTHGLDGVDNTLRWATTYLALGYTTKSLGDTFEALRCLGDIFLARQDEETALSVFQAVLQGSTEMDVHRRRADCMSRIGDILIRRGDVEGAMEMWEKARPLCILSSQMKSVNKLDERLLAIGISEAAVSI
ncbi:hypothetical protein C8J57DRAFT_1513156 [Mycena rebaudengoi]|nr:hypothetical protein C8J57DRAFT_1513156 [Mycena rebaudengoi]